MRSMLLVLAFLLTCAGPGLAQTEANPHGTLPAGMDCGDCHDAKRWKVLRQDARFDHDKTSFPLREKHAATSCTSCHTTLRFTTKPEAPRACASCHTDVHAGRFGRDCASCHDSRSFNAVPGPQAHARTSMPLTGGHAAVPCESCHRDAAAGSFTALNAACASCHLPDYEGVSLPDHVAGKFPQECGQCHNSLAWQGARFEHTAFLLTGPHTTASCTSCHRPDGSGLVFPRPAGQQDCVACHRADYDDEHAGSGYPTTCLTCHRSGNSWDDANFEHTTAANGFALLGAHIRATCGSCHLAPDGRLKFDPKPSTPQECAACHNADYEREHAGSGFSNVCMTCHNMERWDDAVFKHERFPLSGAHTALPCTACHAPPNNGLIYPVPSGSNDCVACHRADYDRQHTGSNFSTNCISCHGNTTWSGATFDHAGVARGFALQGKHASLPCSSCHAPDGRALFAPAGNNDCVTCHRPDYDRAHAGSGYPPTCASCHSQDTWTASFNHDQFFPIFSGKHAGKWSSCQQCHTVASDFRVFSCTTCHAQTKTNADHSQVSGYSYDSNRCYSCHPRGD